MNVTQQPTNLVGQPVESAVWGGVAYDVTQDFGVLGFRPDWYQYSQAHGFPPGYHIGLDVGLPKMTPVYSNTYGMVKAAGPSDYFRPNPVIVETADDPRTGDNEAGFTETYGHLWQDAVTTGQAVKPGTLLGYSGEQTVQGTMTPDGSGPHLHFEVYDPKGNAINPLPLLGIGFTPDPNAPSPGTGQQLSFSGSGVVGGVFDWLPGVTTALSEFAARAGVAIVGFVLLAFGLYAVSRPGGIGGAVRTGGRVAKRAATAVA